MTFGTTVTIDDQDVDVTVSGDFVSGCAQGWEDPGEPDVFDITSIKRDDTGAEILQDLDKETVASIERMGAEDHAEDDFDPRDDFDMWSAA